MTADRITPSTVSTAAADTANALYRFRELERQINRSEVSPKKAASEFNAITRDLIASIQKANS